MPAEGDLNTEGLDIDPDDLAEVLRVDPDGLRAQLPQVKEHLAKFGDALPAEITQQLEALAAAPRLKEPRAPVPLAPRGDVAEWLRSGLQSRLHRFDSGRRLWTARDLMHPIPTRLLLA